MTQVKTGQENAASSDEGNARKPYRQPVLKKAARLSAVTAATAVSQASSSP